MYSFKKLTLLILKTPSPGKNEQIFRHFALLAASET